MDLQHLLTRHCCRTPAAARSAPSFHLSLTLIIMHGISLTLKWGVVKKSRSRKVWKYSQANFEQACALIDATDWDSILAG